MPLVYFILAIVLIIAWLWKPVLIVLGIAVGLYLIAFLINLYKTKPKYFYWIIGLVIAIPIIVFGANRCSNIQDIENTRQFELDQSVDLINKYNISVPVKSNIIYRHINDSLNRCYDIDFRKIFENHIKMENSDGYEYEIFINSTCGGKVAKYENKCFHNHKKMLEDLNITIKSLSDQFGKPTYDSICLDGNIRTTKWEFKKLHILIYGNQTDEVATGFIGIFSPEVLSKNN